MSEQQIPSVGRIVHYVSYGTPGGEYTSQCRAAIVTGEADCDAHMECVSLAVLNPEGMFFNQHVAHNETSQQRGGTWHWPERV
jgi:hypothetical protein